MSNVATIDRPTGPSITVAMADRYGMAPAAFEATLRATVVPKECTREQFAAFLLVAHEYGLNPVLKEIYAFPAKGGGIQPVVGIDGWVRLMNQHPQMDGIEFEDHLDAKQQLTAISAKIHRRDRSHPIVVTEYMSECRRNTEPWKQWPARMLRHKAVIQAVRYAFGYSLILDTDEAERMGADVSGMRDVSPPPAPKAAMAGAIAAPADDPFDSDTGEIIDDPLPPHRPPSFKGGYTAEEGPRPDAPTTGSGVTAPAPVDGSGPATRGLTPDEVKKLRFFVTAISSVNTPAGVERGARAFWQDHGLGDDDPSPLAVAAVAIVTAQTARTRGELSIVDADAVTRKVLPL